MSAKSRIDGLASEVFVLARRLFAVAPEEAERDRSLRRLYSRDPTLLKRCAGKYLRLSGGNGYAYVGKDGSGRFWPELPSGVTISDVVAVDGDLPGTPLQDRLAEIKKNLQASTDPNASALAKAIRLILAACSPEHGGQVFGTVRMRALDALEEPGRQGQFVEQAKYYFLSLGEWANVMRAQPTADGVMTASLFILRDLSLGLAKASNNMKARATALATALSYIATPSPAPLKAVAEGLCRRAVRNRQEEVVRTVAEGLKQRGDRLIDKALDGGFRGFYPPLYDAIAYELAADFIAQSVADISKARRQWLKLAANAEERWVRIAQSLSVAVDNLDGTDLGVRRAIIARLRQRKGVDAARQEANNIIENQLFYPREALPILLGTENAAFRRKGTGPWAPNQR